jgi:hypothetical protein
MSALLSPLPIMQFFTAAGVPLSGGKLYTYAAGTSTPLATYTDSTGNTANTNPVILNSRGEASVWISTSQYKYVLKDSTDTLIWTVDKISTSVSPLVLFGATSGSTTITPVDGVTATITLPSATGTLAVLGANTFTGNQTITGTAVVSGAGFTFSGAGFGLFGTSTSGAGIGTSVQSFTFDSSTATGASPHDICATFKSDVSAGQPLIIWNASSAGDAFFEKYYTEPTGSAALRGSIQYNRGGGVTAFNTTSDYRSKDIAGLLTNAGETIDKLKVYLGTMKGATIARPMLIAHEAQEVVPYAVSGTKDQVDAEGNANFQQMDHQILVPLLLAEIQSLRARLAALEAK